MVRAVDELDLHIDHRIARQHAVLQRFLDALFDRRDVFARDHAADDLVLEDKARADFPDAILGNRMVGGKIYGIPMEVEPMAMYYSVAAFEEAGITEVPKTWDELLVTAKKLTNEKRFGVLFETTPGYYQNFTWYPFLWHGGGEFQTAEGKSAADAAKALMAQRLTLGLRYKHQDGWTGGVYYVQNLVRALGLLPGERRHFRGFLQSIPQGPLAKDRLPRFESGHHEFVVKRHFDRDHDQIDIGMRH